MMELCQVVTEGETDVLLLQAILGIQSNDPQITFVAAGGWSSADSYARTILVQDKAHVALVVDADSRDPNVVEDRKRFLHRSLREVALHKKFHVTVIEPEIEGLLFEAPSLLHELTGKDVSDTDITEAALFGPRKVLGKLMREQDILCLLRDKLPALDLSPLRDLSKMRELKDFLMRVMIDV